MKCILLLCLVVLGSNAFAAERTNTVPTKGEQDSWDVIPPSSSTTIPEAIQDGYWNGQFQRVNREVAAADQSRVVFFGDSITWRWSLAKAEGKTIWQERFGTYNPINMGNSGDITPVMLYRLTHGNLDFPKGQEPAVAVVLCGINNFIVKQSAGGKVAWGLGIDTPPREVADGVRAVAKSFRQGLPRTRVILLGILPMKNEARWAKCKETNRINAAFKYPKDDVVFLDLATHFQNADGSIKAELYVDGTHLTPRGYEALADAIEPEIQRLINAGPIQPAP